MKRSCRIKMDFLVEVNDDEPDKMTFSAREFLIVTDDGQVMDNTGYASEPVVVHLDARQKQEFGAVGRQLFGSGPTTGLGFLVQGMARAVFRD